MNFEDAIGNWRVSTSHINYPTEKYKFKYNKLIQIPLQENEALDVIDEWDTETICKQIIPNSPCVIRAKYPGSGKSFIGAYFKNLGYNVLTVVPHNRLSQEIEGKATTLNMFFSIPVNKGDDLPCFDHSDYNVIFFDEFFMSNIYIYNKIREFVKNNPDKIIIGAGDTKQLPSIQALTNTQPHDEYADRCVDKIFKYSMYLKVCKRVGDILEIMLTYNNKDIHSSIGQTPNEARKKKNEYKSVLNVSVKARKEKMYPELNVGDKVKILRKKAITEKERTSHFLKGEYVVEEITTKLKQKYYKLTDYPRPLMRHDIVKV